LIGLRELSAKQIVAIAMVDRLPKEAQSSRRSSVPAITHRTEPKGGCQLQEAIEIIERSPP